VTELPSWNQPRVQPYNLFVFEPDPRQEARLQLQNWNSLYAERVPMLIIPMSDIIHQKLIDMPIGKTI
jgi:hypothetical protein